MHRIELIEQVLIKECIYIYKDLKQQCEKIDGFPEKIRIIHNSLLTDEQDKFHFNINIKDNKVILAYYFGKRMGRCFEYELIHDNEYAIKLKNIVWVS